MAKIQIKRGLQAAVSSLVLAEGELAVALDTGHVYIGTTIGTVFLNPVKGLAVSQFSNDSGYQTASQVSAAISALIASAPATLDTLNELAAALGDDPNFATTMMNALAGKEALIKNAVAKSTPVDNDAIPLSDSAASNVTKKITFASLKTALKTYFDTLYNKYTHPAYPAKVVGLYKVTVDATGHVSAADAVVKTDITALGIPAQDTVYSLPTASTTVLGGVKIGNGLLIASGIVSVGDLDGGTF